MQVSYLKDESRIRIGTMFNMRGAKIYTSVNRHFVEVEIQGLKRESYTWKNTLLIRYGVNLDQ